MNRNRQLSVAVGKLLANRRKELRRTQSELSKKLNIQRTSLSNIESGKQVLLLDAFYCICTELAVSPGTILENAIHGLDNSITPLEEVDKALLIGQNNKQ